MKKLPLYDKINYFLLMGPKNPSKYNKHLNRYHFRQWMSIVIMGIAPLINFSSILMSKKFPVFSIILYGPSIIAFLLEIPLLIQLAAEEGNINAIKINKTSGYISMFLLGLSLIFLTYHIPFASDAFETLFLIIYLFYIVKGNFKLNNKKIGDNILKSHKKLLHKENKKISNTNHKSVKTLNKTKIDSDDNKMIKQISYHMRYKHFIKRALRQELDKEAVELMNNNKNIKKDIRKKAKNIIAKKLKHL